jgi:hypothetical protein
MIATMRTTVTLDPDVEALLRHAMKERGLSFKEALNQAIRAGLGRPEPRRGARFRTKAFAMGKPHLPLEKALAIAAELEDEEVIRKLQLGK